MLPSLNPTVFIFWEKLFEVINLFLESILEINVSNSIWKKKKWKILKIEVIFFI